MELMEDVRPVREYKQRTGEDFASFGVASREFRARDEGEAGGGMHRSGAKRPKFIPNRNRRRFK
jgi:hypothetical protein